MKLFSQLHWALLFVLIFYSPHLTSGSRLKLTNKQSVFKGNLQDERLMFELAGLDLV